MNKEKSINKDLFFTRDHEWNDFQGAVAYAGICHFKLPGFKQIHQITITNPPGFRKQGDIIAIIKYNDYQVEMHMPVDGKVIEMNDKIVSGDQNILLHHAETSGWIALIVPSQPYERQDLLPPKQYGMNSKSKYAK